MVGIYLHNNPHYPTEISLASTSGLRQARGVMDTNTTTQAASPKGPLITDEQSLDSAAYASGTPIKTYDDGYGPLWVHQNSLGITGIVRARTWEDAYSICEDEFFPAGDDFDPEEFKTIYMSRRELWLHEHGNSWEAWQALTEQERDEIVYHGSGKDVPFAGEFSDHPCWQEQYGFRNNARKEADGTLSSIYAKDINGDRLEPLTPEFARELGVVVKVSTPKEELSPYRAGYCAYEDNDALSNNPYALGTSEFDKWREGWIQAEHEMQAS